MCKKIIIKLDDFGTLTKKVKYTDKIVKFFKIKVCWGIIGQRFETTTEKDIIWCKNALKSGLYYFFNHGYTHIHNEFKELTLEEQIEHLMKTQSVVKDKLNIVLDTFGAPCNSYNKEMVKALEHIQNIKYWLYGEDKYNKTNFNIPSTNIEHPFPNANFKKFRAGYKKCSDDLIVLQGHPNSWKFKHFLEFIKIIIYLKLKNCEFIFTKDV